MPQQLTFAALSADEQKLFTDLLDFLFDKPGNEEAIQFIEEKVQEYKEPKNEKEALVLLFLQAIWHFFTSQYHATTTANWAFAVEHMEEAYRLFSAMQMEEMVSLSDIMRTYYGGIFDMRNNNLKSGLEKQEKARQMLEKAGGRYAKNYSGLMLHMDPDIYFSLALQDLMSIQLDNAQMHINKAFDAAQKAARLYSENSPEQHNWLGIGNYYMAYFLYIRATYLFKELEFDHPDFQSTARFDKYIQQAIRHLNQGTLNNKNILNLMYLAKSISLQYKVQTEVAGTMLSIMKDQTHTLPDWAALKNLTQSAIQLATQIGEKGMDHIRVCKSTLRQINNVERLAASHWNKVAQNQTPAPSHASDEKQTPKTSSLSKELINRCRKLIASNKINEVFELLINEVSEPQLVNNIILQSSRLSQLEEELNCGTLSRADFLTGKSQIEKRVLEIFT